jgi:hypothetical protein
MKYKFEQFNVEIDNPTIEVVKVSDDIKEKTCAVLVFLTTDSTRFGVDLDGFTYSDTWEDADVYAWVESELEKYKV